MDSQFIANSLLGPPDSQCLQTPLDIDTSNVVCVNERLVYQEYLSNCTSDADCGPAETCLAPSRWHVYAGLRPSGYVIGTACASDIEAVKTFCLLDSNCTAVVAEYDRSSPPELVKACLFHGSFLPGEQLTNFTTFAKLELQVGPCVRHVQFETPAPAPAALSDIRRASLMPIRGDTYRSNPRSHA